MNPDMMKYMLIGSGVLFAIVIIAYLILTNKETTTRN